MAEIEQATAPVASDSTPTESIDLVPATAPEKKKVTKLVKKKRRPARVQLDPAEFESEPPPQTGTIFNIWFNKWSGGDREDKYLSKTKAKGRLNVARDSGYTRADKIPGSFFCLFFARGICHRGSECEYLHRLPTVTDIFSSNVDGFGRDKFSDYRDDMGGVGSFLRQNRTLYIGRIHVTDDIEEIVARHFSEFGLIDRIRVLTSRGVGFVTYTNEANAQFAREAMAHQSLDHDEILNVRWATVDPNPAAQKREARRIEEQAAEAIRAALPPDYVAEIEGRDPEAKKRRKVEGGFGLQGYDAPDDVWYAKEKASLEASQAAELEGLEAPEEKLMIEGPGQQQSLGGILSGSTLAALQSHRGGSSVAFSTVKKPGATKGPLVGYGSDDDSD